MRNGTLLRYVLTEGAGERSDPRRNFTLIFKYPWRPLVHVGLMLAAPVMSREFYDGVSAGILNEVRLLDRLRADALLRPFSEYSIKERFKDLVSAENPGDAAFRESAFDATRNGLRAMLDRKEICAATFADAGFQLDRAIEETGPSHPLIETRRGDGKGRKEACNVRTDLDLMGML